MGRAPKLVCAQQKDLLLSPMYRVALPISNICSANYVLTRPRRESSDGGTLVVYTVPGQLTTRLGFGLQSIGELLPVPNPLSFSFGTQ